MLTIDTKNFAAMLGIPERELVDALMSDNLLNGYALPKPAKGYKGRTRRFDYQEAVKFSDLLKESKK